MKRLVIILIVIIIAVFPTIHYGKKTIAHFNEKRTIKEVKKCVNEYWKKREVPKKRIQAKYPNKNELIVCSRENKKIIFGFMLSKDIDTAFVTGTYSYYALRDEYKKSKLIYDFEEIYVKKDEDWIFLKMTKHERDEKLERIIMKF